MELETNVITQSGAHVTTESIPLQTQERLFSAPCLYGSNIPENQEKRKCRDF